MNRRLLLPLIACLLILAACLPDRQESPRSTPTLDPLQPLVDANSSQATAVSAVATARYYSDQLTATVESRSATATTEAFTVQAEATERAWQATATADSVRSTSVAQMTATQQSQSLSATQQAQSVTATADAINSAAFATAMHGQSESVRLAVEREQLTNQARAILPITLSVVTIIIALVLVWRYMRVRPIQRDGRGDAPLLVIDGAVYDADRNPLPVLHLDKGQPKIPSLTPPELQAPTTARDQAIDLARGLSGGRTRQQAQRAMSAADQPGFQVIQPDKLPPLLAGDPQVTEILDADWREDEPE